MIARSVPGWWTSDWPIGSLNPAGTMPVRSFGDPDARLLIVGWRPAPERTERAAVHGDYAGELLYQTLIEFGFATGSYLADPADGLVLNDCMVSNAVRCVPPQNKPTPGEVTTCRRFLIGRIAALDRLEAVLALGRIAHESTLVALGARRAAFPFAHGAKHAVRPNLTLFDSYHCSRYNTSTGKLTPQMFKAVLQAIRDHLGPLGRAADLRRGAPICRTLRRTGTASINRD